MEAIGVGETFHKQTESKKEETEDRMLGTPSMSRVVNGLELLFHISKILTRNTYVHKTGPRRLAKIS